MGCICGKEAATQEERESPKRNVFRIGSRRFASGRLSSIDVGNVVIEKERDRSKDRSKQNGIASAIASEDEKKENYGTASAPFPRLSNPPLNVQGEQVAAGWPAWLSAVAGDAIIGWIPRKADSFEKLDKIGQGTYSNVYKARDLDTGKIVALKKVRFDNLEPESVRFMAREIQVLRRLDHPNVVKLEGLVTSRMSCSLYLVFEYMEHDLAGLAACPGIKFTEPQVKCYLQQLLRGLEHCHSHGVLHRDIKGSNLLLDNEGILKIADFGLATFFHPDQKQPLTSRVITLWYRPPELLLGATEYGVAVDLWSTGCILAELLAGKPIMPGRTEVEQLHKIFKLCGSPSEDYWKKSKLPHATIFKPQQPYKRCISEVFKDFPQSALVSLETLLAIEPSDRGTAASALKSEFFTTNPLACDPSSLPKYPPSKELDAKIREEEARRQRAAGGRGRGSEVLKKGGLSNKTAAALGANAELAAVLQKRRLASHSSKSKSEKFGAKHDDSAVGFPIDPPRPVDAAEVGRVYASHPGLSGPLPYPSVPAMGLKKQKKDDSHMLPPHLPSRSTKFVSVADLQRVHDTQACDVSPSTLISPWDICGRQIGGTGAGSMVQNSKNEQSELSEAAKQAHMEPKQSQVYSIDSEGFQLLDSTSQSPPAQVQRIHFSGPLLHSSAKLEDILGEHERHIRQAVRRAKHEKGKIQHSALSNKTWVNGAHGSSEVMNSGNCHGARPTGTGWQKSPRPKSSGEITELCETDQGLSSVIEEREQET